MTHQEIREKFIKFFEARGHKAVSSSSLLPTDSSVLFTTAGMQQFKEYYTSPDNAPAKNVASIQKCMRTSSIDEVGDDSHLTFFEMLGNFSFGGYWKEEAIRYSYDFITKELGLTIDYVSIFGGEDGIPVDIESENIWKSIDPSLEIKRLSREDNFWGPTGEEGPCGPCTEIFVKGIKYEIWNIVFNEFYCSVDKKFTPLEIKGIDTGMGLERLMSAVQNKTNVFETDLFEPLIKLLPSSASERVQRIMADHARATTFLISDGVTPSNKDQGYVLRRLARRLIVHAHTSNIETETIRNMIDKVVELYGKYYPELNTETIKIVFNTENDKFQKTFKNGLRELEKLAVIDAPAAFKLFESFGLPYEVTKEIGATKAESLTREGFEEEFKKHQEKSRAGAEKKFGGHGMKEGEPMVGDVEETKKKTRLHTATHIVVASLEKVLGEPLKQAGADINTERLRFDFAFPRKLTPEELQQAEKIANQTVADNLEVWFEELPLEEAFASGAHGAFAHKYPPHVKVYTVGPKSSYFSREICGGPHVSHTGEIGHIKITKEESVSGGNRRIRAVVD